MKKLNKESEENRCVGAIINRQRGITLISLVITIVVLIILAGVAINLTLGENGIFKKAQEAKKMQTIATAKEQIGLEILEAQIEAMENNEELEQSKVEAIVAKYGVLQADGDTIVLNDSGYEVSLSDIYNTMANTETDGDTTIELAQLKALLSQTTVTEDKILKDYKAYKDGQLITGTMENYAGKTQDATMTSDDTYTYLSIPNNGYYTTGSKLKIENSSINSLPDTLGITIKVGGHTDAGGGQNHKTNITQLTYGMYKTCKLVSKSGSHTLQGCKINGTFVNIGDSVNIESVDSFDIYIQAYTSGNVSALTEFIFEMYK